MFLYSSINVRYRFSCPWKLLHIAESVLTQIFCHILYTRETHVRLLFYADYNRPLKISQCFLNHETVTAVIPEKKISVKIMNLKWFFFLPTFFYFVQCLSSRCWRKKRQRNMKFLSQLITFDSAPINLLVFSISPFFFVRFSGTSGCRKLQPL